LKQDTVARILGIVVGVLTLLSAFGFLVLSFIGTSLGRALNSEMEYSLSVPLIIFVILIGVGIVTIIGGNRLKNNNWRKFYLVFSIVIGLSLVISFFVTSGAVGTTHEFIILFIGLIYLALGYTARRK